MAMRGLLLLLLLAVWVTVAPSRTPCNPGECLSDDLCCQCCPAGHFVTKPCQENHGVAECAPCKPGTFMAHPNLQQGCFLCSQCREDQEVVSNCSSTADRQCQCMKGYYCDSEDCVEHCFQCSSCSNSRAVLVPCHPKANTVCARTNQEPANSNWYTYVIPVAAVIIIIIIIIITAYRYFRRAATSGPEQEASCDRSSDTGISAEDNEAAALNCHH